MDELYESLESTIRDPLFPTVDVQLRRGSCVNADDVEAYAFIQAAEAHLQDYYRAYDCRLVHGPEGYYFLLSEGDLLGHSHLKKREMLVGCALALMAMDPQLAGGGGRFTVEALIQQLQLLLGEEHLRSALAQRRRGQDKSGDAEKLRQEIRGALGVLARLNFIYFDRAAQIVTSKQALHRFVEPVRRHQDLRESLLALEETGVLKRGSPSEEGDVEDDGDDEEGEDG